MMNAKNNERPIINMSIFSILGKIVVLCLRISLLFIKYEHSNSLISYMICGYKRSSILRLQCAEQYLFEP